MVENAIYTPSPETISVVCYRDYLNIPRCVWAEDFDDARLQVPPDHIDSREIATVIARGDLLSDGTRRWHQVLVASGATHMVQFYGS